MSQALTSLVSALPVRSRMAALEEAISTHRESLSFYTTHSDRFPSLNKFSNALLNLYDVRGSLADLEEEEAISLHRESLSMSHNNLGYALRLQKESF
jgi:hypothetical protein